MRRVAAILGFVLLIALATDRAQSQSTEPVAQHAWFLVRHEPGVDGAAGAGPSASVFHLPPRGQVEGEGAPGGQWGVVRYGTGLSEVPEQIAWWGDRVYLVFPALEYVEGRRSRRVLTMTAVPGTRAGRTVLWENDPADRPDVAPSLVGDDAIIGMVGSEYGPVALLHGGPEMQAVGGSDRGPESGGWGLRLLHDSAWVRLPVPWEWTSAGRPGPGAACHVLPGKSGRDVSILVCDAASDEATLWEANIESLRQRDGTRAWHPGVLRIWPPDDEAFAEATRPELEPDTVTRVEGTVVSVSRSSEGTLYLWRHSERSVFPLATIPGAPAEYLVAPLDGAASVSIIWSERTRKPEAGVDPATREGNAAPERGYTGQFVLHEISVLSGQVLFQGVAVRPGPITGRDLMSMVMLLMVIAVGVLVFVLRPGLHEPYFPPGYALADPLRRFAAGFIDVVPCVAAASLLAGVAPTKILRPGVFFGSEADVGPFLLTMALLFVYGTLTEWLFGRTLGKLLVGCRVVSGRSGAGQEAVPIRLALWQAAVRNSCKAFLPLLMVLVLIDPTRRHPGDHAARTWVVVRSD